MKILFIGDIVGSLGRKTVKEVLPGLIASDSIDFVIANAENILHGRGASKEILSEVHSYGVDYFTGGDHIFWHKGFDEEIEDTLLVRPANFPEPTPGKKIGIIDKGDKGKVAVINLMGRTFLNDNLDNPFTRADDLLAFIKEKEELRNAFVLVDFHGEATSEKVAMGMYLDGKVGAVLGTHTHVPTCDERPLQNGTYYVTDVGMTGSTESVLGVKTEIILNLFLTARNQKFEWVEDGPSVFRSVLIDTEKKTIHRCDRLINRF